MELSFILFAMGVTMAVATMECNHVVQLCHDGKVVEMDVIQNFEENTALIMVGDVSKYSDERSTVNLHDYNTGYLALKDINAKVCLLTKFEGQTLPTSTYEKGLVTDVHYYTMSEVSDKMSYETVLMTAGPKIAEFCREYTVKLEKTTAIAENEMEKNCPKIIMYRCGVCGFSNC